VKAIQKILLALFFLISSVHPALAQIDQKRGIHILHPEEITKAHQLLNISPTGHKSYVTIPFTLEDLQKEAQWKEFFAQAKEYNIVPLVRLVSEFDGTYWTIPTRKNIVDQINFLSKFEWPTDEKHIIIFNEPNHKSEFGGVIDPAHYAEILSFAADWAHTQNKNFKVLPAALDQAAPNGFTTMEGFRYLGLMLEAEPTIIDKIDYWNSHSYPNPGFIASPYGTAKNTLRGFEHELNYIKQKTGKDLKVFITETGWLNNYLTTHLLDFYYKYAATYIWSDERVIAITPFLLQGDPGPFAEFGFIDRFSQPTKHYTAYQKTFISE
jgi:hypothetical protein